MPFLQSFITGYIAVLLSFLHWLRILSCGYVTSRDRSIFWALLNADVTVEIYLDV